ncbi:MAG: glycosyltransferase [Pseudomonadota bacterium]
MEKLKIADKMPLVSVLLPVFNGALTIKKSIESITSQTYPNLQIIIINDGSTDNTLDVIEKTSKNDSRFKIISRENKGLIHTLNEGLSIAAGKYIAREDADDYSHPDRIKKQVKYLENNPKTMVLGTNNILFGHVNNKVHYPTDPDKSKAHLMFSPPVSHPSTMLRKSFFIDNNLSYNLQYPHCEDYALWMNVIDCGGDISNLNEFLHFYREHENNISKVHSSTTINGHYKISRQLLKKLQINFSDEDLMLFIGAETKQIYTSLDLIKYKKILELHNHVYDQNKIHKIYNDVHLKDIFFKHTSRYIENKLGSKALFIQKSTQLYTDNIKEKFNLYLTAYKRDLINLIKSIIKK